MVRLIIRISSVCPVEGATEEHTYKTFDVELPEVEEFLSEKMYYGSRTLVGAEVIKQEETDERHDKET